MRKMIDIRVRALLNPTESQDKLETAIRRILGNLELKRIDVNDRTYLEAELNGIKSLDHLHSVLRRDRVRDAFRRILSSWADEDRLYFKLNRQAAYAGHASLHMEESPLGPIEITITGDALEAVEYLCS